MSTAVLLKVKDAKVDELENSVLIHTRWKFILSATCLHVSHSLYELRFYIRGTAGVLGLPLLLVCPLDLISGFLV